MREVPQLAAVLSKLFADITIPKWVIAAAGACIGYCFPDASQREAAGSCFAMVLLDTLTGVVASRVSNEVITSAKLSRALVKLLAYFSTVCVVISANHNIPGAKQYQGASVTMILTLILSTEMVSILENCRKMGFRLPLGLDTWLQQRLLNAGGNAPSEGEKKDEKTTTGG